MIRQNRTSEQKEGCSCCNNSFRIFLHSIIIWNESPRWRAKRREADASINRTARKAKPVVHEQDVPEVCSEFGRLIYGDDESDIEDRASHLRRVANKSSDLLDSDAMLSESSGINSGASDMDGREDDEEDED